MYAAAEGKSWLGIPKKVGEEYVGKKDGLSRAIHDAVADEVIRKHNGMEVCAGILLRARGTRFLLLKQADEKWWVQPGGHVRDGEGLLEGAIRETEEETGHKVEGTPLFLRESTSGGVAYSTFILDVPPFEPALSDESTDFVWATADDMPKDVHPEVAKAITLASGTELDIAKAIKSGELSSPQRFENIWLFNVRITGTGTSYRQALDEYVYRPPEDFLSDDFLERCNGLPFIFEHPVDSILTTEEYRQRAVGNVVLPYIRKDEVWGIAKVYDEDAAQLMRSTHASTSPAVVFRNASVTDRIELDDGQSILIEGKPSYLDHLAICEEGVWDKGGNPSGIRSDNEESAMAEEEKAPAWADALCKRLDSIEKRMDEERDERKDSFDGLVDKLEGKGYSKEYATKVAGKVAAEKGETGKRKDSEEEAEKHGEEEEREEHKASAALERAEKEGKEEREEEKDSKRKDAKRKDESKEEETKEEAKEEREEKKDAKRKDESEEEREERDDAEGCSMDRKDAQTARENAELRRKIADMESRVGRLVRPLSMDERNELAEVQARADSLAQMFGDSVTPPLFGETPIEYRKRVAAKFQKHSADVKDVKLDSLDETTFRVIENKIFSDAQAVARNPDAAPEGKLFPHRTTDSTGRTITTYHGDPKVWMKPFMARGFRGRFADSATRRGVN